MNILLIEDDQDLAEFVRGGLVQEGFGVDHYTNGPDGLAAAMTGEYEAAIVDLMLPELDGISIVKSLRRRREMLPILIISARQRVEERVRGLDAGADDFLVKPFAFSELQSRLRALIRRASGRVETSLLQVEDLTLDIFSREVRRGGQLIDLQPREFDLLLYLMRNAGRVVTKTMIIEQVWHFSFSPQTNIVEARISKLREKVDKGFSPKLIQTVRGAGYVLRSQG